MMDSAVHVKKKKIKNQLFQEKEKKLWNCRGEIDELNVQLPVVGVDVDASVYADVGDDAIPVADMAKAVPQLGQHDPRIDYLVHDEDDQLDQLFVLL